MTLETATHEPEDSDFLSYLKTQMSEVSSLFQEEGISTGLCSNQKVQLEIFLNSDWKKVEHPFLSQRGGSSTFSPMNFSAENVGIDDKNVLNDLEQHERDRKNVGDMKNLVWSCNKWILISVKKLGDGHEEECGQSKSSTPTGQLSEAENDEEVTLKEPGKDGHGLIYYGFLITEYYLHDNLDDQNQTMIVHIDKIDSTGLMEKEDLYWLKMNATDSMKLYNQSKEYCQHQCKVEERAAKIQQETMQEGSVSSEPQVVSLPRLILQSYFSFLKSKIIDTLAPSESKTQLDGADQKDSRLLLNRIDIHVFSRSQPEYLFLRSSESKMKKSLKHKQLIRWWKQTLSEPHVSTTMSETKIAQNDNVDVGDGENLKTTKLWYVPNETEDSMREPTSMIQVSNKKQKLDLDSQEWIWDFPFRRFGKKVKECVPMFPEDAKSALIRNLSEQSPKELEEMSVDEFASIFSVIPECTGQNYSGIFMVRMERMCEHGGRDTIQTASIDHEEDRGEQTKCINKMNTNYKQKGNEQIKRSTSSCIVKRLLDQYTFQSFHGGQKSSTEIISRLKQNQIPSISLIPRVISNFKLKKENTNSTLERPVINDISNLIKKRKKV